MAKQRKECLFLWLLEWAGSSSGETELSGILKLGFMPKRIGIDNGIAIRSFPDEAAPIFWASREQTATRWKWQEHFIPVLDRLLQSPGS